ncbi:MAG: hypothetical protein RLZZ511_3718 [Cyanobacteriota bacterium]|jgi:hypothetical protein
MMTSDRPRNPRSYPIRCNPVSSNPANYLNLINPDGDRQAVQYDLAYTEPHGPSSRPISPGNHPTNMIMSSQPDSLPAESIGTTEEDLFDRIDDLRREDETLYNILAVDVWALAKTMDEFQPGFWSEFMKNRERALRRFMSEVVKTKPKDVQRPPFLR